MLTLSLIFIAGKTIEYAKLARFQGQYACLEQIEADEYTVALYVGDKCYSFFIRSDEDGTINSDRSFYHVELVEGDKYTMIENSDKLHFNHIYAS